MTPAFGRWKQENQNLKAIVSYTWSLRDILGYVKRLKTNMEKKKCMYDREGGEDPLYFPSINGIYYFVERKQISVFNVSKPIAIAHTYDVPPWRPVPHTAAI